VLFIIAFDAKALISQNHVFDSKPFQMFESHGPYKKEDNKCTGLKNIASDFDDQKPIYRYAGQC
jgi:hypothetical protein